MTTVPFSLRWRLAYYDAYVVGFSTRFVWHCPSPLLLEFYDQHVSSKHLDVGVGSGYYLDKCKFPAPSPSLALVDSNPPFLKFVAQRVRRYQPRTYTANVLAPMTIDEAGFDSIGINYLLHCLPGAFADKSVVFENLKPLLSERGVMFGATILGGGVPMNWLARRTLQKRNRDGTFSNLDDDESGLDAILKKTFPKYSLRVVGCVALFAGWG